MIPDSTAHLLQLVTIALDEFESAPVSATLRRAWRIARLRGDAAMGLRFALELGVTEELGDTTRSTEVDAIRQEAQARFMAGRTRDIDASKLGLEDVDAFLFQPLDRLEVEARPYEQELSLRSRLQRENRRAVASDIVAGVRVDIFQYLMRCETTLRLSVTGERIFDRHRRRVDRFLEAVAPDVLDMLNAAINRASAGDEPEARVHALTSCRRVLTAVADVVYPPRDEPHVDDQGVAREVGVSQYRNRILAALDNSRTTTLGRALSASITEFAGRLDRLDALTQKGVHEHPTEEDVDFGVIQTYLLAGDVLSICLESGSLMADGTPNPADETPADR